MTRLTRDSADLAMAEQSSSGDVAAGIIGKIMKGEGYGTTAPPPLNKDASELTIFKNVTYIVTGIVIRNGEVLMMQEAKLSCRGKWYLPAGRMERNESIEDAVKREVAEETGLEFKPRSVISVEFGSLWIRFTVIGDAIGGELKTSDKADRESLQAGWYSADVSKLQQSLSLRARDILPLIELAVKWTEKDKLQKAYNRLPVLTPLHGFSLAIVAISRKGCSLKLLKSKNPDSSVLVYSFARVDVVYSTLSDIVKEKLETEGIKGESRITGVLSLEHDGRGGKDGLHIDLLVEVTPKDLEGDQWEEIKEGPEYRWIVKCLDKDIGCIELIQLY